MHDTQSDPAESPLQCAISSAAVETLVGTAPPERTRWWLIEDRSPWSRKGFPGGELPPAAQERLVNWKRTTPGAAVHLIRHPAHCSGPYTAFYVDTRPGPARIVEIHLPAPDALLQVPLDDPLASPFPANAWEPGATLYLVCTHGRRDLCCARLGAPVFRALDTRAPGRVWQSTHLGGHRYAATLLALPQGVSLGRVQPGQAEDLTAALDAGRLPGLATLRGRTAWPRAVQAAEHAAREAGNLLDLDAVREPTWEQQPDASWTVQLTAGTKRLRYSVRQQQTPRRVRASCGDDTLRPVHQWVVERLP